MIRASLKSSRKRTPTKVTKGLMAVMQVISRWNTARSLKSTVLNPGTSRKRDLWPSIIVGINLQSHVPKYAGKRLVWFNAGREEQLGTNPQKGPHQIEV